MGIAMSSIVMGTITALVVVATPVVSTHGAQSSYRLRKGLPNWTTPTRGQGSSCMLREPSVPQCQYGLLGSKLTASAKPTQFQKKPEMGTSRRCGTHDDRQEAADTYNRPI